MRLVLLALPFLAACTAPPVQTTFEPPYPEHDAAGTPILASFEGRIPCAMPGCDKLKVTLTLYEGSYWLGVVPGIPDAHRAAATGSWSTVRGVPGYPDAQVLVLDAKAGEGLRYFWRVNEDILLVLDPDRRPKAGNAAWGYMLSRDARPYGPRTYEYDARARRFTGAMVPP